MPSRKTLVKTIETPNHIFALAEFRKYSNEDWPDVYATISKREEKGGDKKKQTIYIVKVYELYEQSF